MRKSIEEAAVIVLLLFAAGCAQAAPKADAIVGTWQANRNSAVISIYKNGTMYFGKIDHAVNSSGESVGGGEVILTNFSFDSSSRQWGGEVYAPRMNKYFRAVITLTDTNTLTITVDARGQERSATWKRIR